MCVSSEPTSCRKSLQLVADVAKDVCELCKSKLAPRKGLFKWDIPHWI
jgi:hypothetical protein